MNKFIFILYFFVFTLACRNNNSAIGSNEHTPLSMHDPKAFQNPDELYGDLFDSVQLNSVFSDSKTFVDCIPKTDVDNILTSYETERQKRKFILQEFVNQYFTLNKQFAYNKQINTSQPLKSQLESVLLSLIHPADSGFSGSLITLPNPYVIKDPQATNLTYWDSYFAMLGFQAIGRGDMIDNMVKNFAYLIDTEGYVPFGNRSYFLSRSQPPFFSCMIQILAEIKGEEVYKKYLPQLEKEYAFWMEGRPNEKLKGTCINRRVISIDGNVLNRYWDGNDKPRPEYYKEDISTAHNSGQDINLMYQHIRASAESGWDESSRWYETGKDSTILHASDVIPIDLNALLYNLEIVIMKGKILDKKLDEAAKYEKLAYQRREALMRYCWSDDKQMFFDFDFQKYKKEEVYSLAAVYPLFFKMVTKREADSIALAIEKMFLKPGGVVTTLRNSGLSWDAPNGFAPLQWMTIKALRNYGHNTLADDIKKRWIELNLDIYKKEGRFLDKYNVENMATQDVNSYSKHIGYSWTVGVLLKLMNE